MAECRVDGAVDEGFATTHRREDGEELLTPMGPPQAGWIIGEYVATDIGRGKAAVDPNDTLDFAQAHGRPMPNPPNDLLNCLAQDVRQRSMPA